MKKLLVALVVLVVVVVAAALIAPFLIPTDTYTARLTAAVKSATGRDLKIAGPVKLAFLPRLELDAADVSFANAPGAHDPDMAQLKKLEVTLRVLPLLTGRIELGRFVLTEPRISLEIDKQGTPNWVFSPSAAPAAAARPSVPSAAPPAAAPATRGGGIGLSGLSLGDVRLVDGQVSYRDDRTGSEETVQGINMTLSLPDLDHPLAGEGAAVWHDQKLTLSLGVAKPGALLGGGESDAQLRLSGAPLDVGFQGSLTGLPPAKLAGTIDLTVPSVRGLASWAGSPLPPGGGLQKFAIKGRIERSGTKTTFTDADIALDAITAKGSLAVATGGQRPAISGSLAIDTLDVNPYLPPEAPAGQASGAPAAGSAKPSAGKEASQGWSDAPFDVAPLKLVDVDFALKAGAIRYRKIQIGQSALDLRLLNGKLTTTLSQLALYKGNGKGSVTVDGSGAVPAVAMDFALKGVAVGPLLADAAGTDRLEGTGNVDFTASGTGASQRALVSALNGKGALDLANGQLKGVNLIALAENATSPLTGANAQTTTPFGSLTGTFTITNGILKNDDLQLKSGVIPVTGAGTVSLPARTVNYRITVSLAGAVGVPVLVSGPWDDLSYKPDLAGALQGATQAPQKALEQLRNLGNGAGSGNPANALKNLFGK